MRSIALGFICLAAVGCGEDATVSGVFPASGFLGRTMRVQVTGDNTSWDSSTGLDFGPGVTVSSVSVASPTSLSAEIVITDAATAGLRDVIVTGSDGGSLSSAFDLQSPLKVDWRGNRAQGSIARFTVHNLDFTSPFDDTCTAASLFGCSEYGNTNVESPTGTFVALDLVSPYTLSGTMYIDTDAVAGDFQVLSGAADQAAVISPLGEQLDIAARTATPITGGMVTQTVAAAYDSQLFSLDAAANSLTRFSASSAGGVPTLYVLGSTGHFEDLVTAAAAPNLVTQTGGSYYVIVDNSDGDSGFAYTLRANPLAVTPAAEADTAGANDTAANAQTLATIPALVTGGEITADTDEDWFKFTVPSGSAAKKVHVVTAAGDPVADEAIEIYAKSGGTAPGTLISGANPIDRGYHENAVSAMAVGAATEVYVHIFVDPDYYNPQQTKYVAAIWLE
jgi:hypothetical protein